MGLLAKISGELSVGEWGRARVDWFVVPQGRILQAWMDAAQQRGTQPARIPVSVPMMPGRCPTGSLASLNCCPCPCSLLERALPNHNHVTIGRR